VTKSAVMAHFDATVTAPAVSRAGVAAFLAAPERAGALYQGRYAV
jgi:hypothetical protein